MLKLLFILLLTITVNVTYGQPPAFKGGGAALNNFLTQKIIYPEYSRQNCIPGTIKVSFRLDKSGKVYDAKVSQGLGIDLDDEALRVVKLTSGKWLIPADYHSSIIILPVIFQPDAAKCSAKNSADINQAIQAYKIEQRQQDAITNYYKAKYAGKTDTRQETDIINLKNQLGYDDDFISDVLEQAKEKLQQSDTTGACHDWTFIHNIGSNRADEFLARYCK